MRVGGPLVSQFNYLFQQAMRPAKVTDTCVPTQWFGPMAKAEFPRKTTLHTWWNQTQEGRPVLNDGVAAFNYQPPPCQHHRTFKHDLGSNIILGVGLFCTLLGFIFFGFKRSQIKADIRERAALEAAGALRSDDGVLISSEPVEVPLMITPLPRPASDQFEVAALQGLAQSESASAHERD